MRSRTVTRATKPDVALPVGGRAAKGQAEPRVKARAIELPRSLTARQLADMLQVSPLEIIKQLMRKGIMANINQVLDYDVAAPIAADLGFEARLKVRAEAAPTRETRRQRHKEEAAGNLQPRAPVVTIMGHVDHGKTKLLDAIRQSNVVATEAGGITQHIGAYQAEVNGQKVTFLDTPGHEAFTAMRARGAQVTDIVVLVVAADDGVMPQTLEAIDHARAAGVPIVAAINKIDLPGANPDRVRQQLADAGLVCEDWGGDTVCVLVSAKQKLGIPSLLENLLLVAELEELRADPTRLATGVVVEANLAKTKGPLATVLIQDGSLRVGETVVVGNTWGRIKAMFNDRGKQVRKAEPAMPIELLGLNSVPQVGDTLTVVASDQQARAEIEKRQAETAATASVRTLRLENLFDQISTGKVKELNVILKTDVQGSIEPIRQSLERLATEQVKVRLIHSASGNVTENDVMLAVASKGLIIGFATGIEPGAKRMAEAEGIDIRIYNIIYNLVDDIEKALKGMLEPTYIEVIDGRAEVRAIFGKGKKDKVAGALVSEGKLTRGALVRVRRQGKVIVESTISSLRRFKEDVREVATGYECGVGAEGFSDFQVGDILETYRKQKEV